MKIAGVLETCLYATDLEAARASTKGYWAWSFSPSSRGGICFFGLGRGSFWLIPQATLQETVFPLHGALGSVHECFRVRALDLQTWAEPLPRHLGPVESRL